MKQSVFGCDHGMVHCFEIWILQAFLTAMRDVYKKCQKSLQIV